MSALSLWLLCAALFLLLAWLIPPASNCWIPNSAPTRGFYEKCWQIEELSA